MWVGFALNAVSGVALFIADATNKATQPVFFIKLVFVAVGMVNIHLFPGDMLRERGNVPARGKVFAVTSLVVWAGAITAGRLMAYLKTP